MLPPLNLTARRCPQAEVAGPGVHEKAAEQGEHHPRHRQGRHNLKDRARQVQGGLTAILFNVFFFLLNLSEWPTPLITEKEVCHNRNMES